jgi:hypothetical protein
MFRRHCKPFSFKPAHAGRSCLPCTRALVDGDVGRVCAWLSPRGARGGTWIAKVRNPDSKRHLEALGAADNARDADGLSVYSLAQAHERAAPVPAQSSRGGRRTGAARAALYRC